MDYWKECISEAADECGATLTDAQIASIAKMVEGAHENFGTYTGQEVADRNWRAARDSELERTDANKVLRYVEDRLAQLDAGPSKAFDHLDHNQRLAMHELFAARDFLRRDGVPVT